MTLEDEILREMQAASDAVDDAYGTSEYEKALIALALIARHFLRERAQTVEWGDNGPAGSAPTTAA